MKLGRRPQSASELAALDDTNDRDFGQWVRPHLAAMSAVAGRLVGLNDRDDVVQEALARAYRKRTHFDETRGTPRAWLVAIVVDQARQHRRGLTRLRGWADEKDADTAIDDHLPDVDLKRCIAKLTGKQRLVVELVYFADLPLSEVASVMGVRVGTVKSNLSDARARLRQQLEGEPGG